MVFMLAAAVPIDPDTDASATVAAFTVPAPHDKLPPAVRLAAFVAVMLPLTLISDVVPVVCRMKLFVVTSPDTFTLPFAVTLTAASLMRRPVDVMTSAGRDWLVEIAMTACEFEGVPVN